MNVWDFPGMKISIAAIRSHLKFPNTKHTFGTTGIISITRFLLNHIFVFTFAHQVPAFGKLGCDPNQKAAEEKMPNGSDGSSGQSGGAGIFAKLANKVRTIGRIMGMM